MPLAGPVPDWLLWTVAAATLFTLMFDVGLAVVPLDFRWVVERPGLFAKALFAVLVAVPVIAWIVGRALQLPRAVEIGIMLMAIAPGAPVALRQSLQARGHRAFAPVLQVALAVLAIVCMPLWVAGFDEYYAGDATVDPRHLARQVFFAQLLPLGLGALTRQSWAAGAAWLEPRLRLVASLLLILLTVLALVNVWQIVIGAGVRVAIAVVAVTSLALAAGHALGGPDAATRTATAISSAMRNTGLALLVATINEASPAIVATVLAYFVLSALTVIPYVIWRRRTAPLPAT